MIPGWTLVLLMMIFFGVIAIALVGLASWLYGLWKATR